MKCETRYSQSVKTAIAVLSVRETALTFERPPLLLWEPLAGRWVRELSPRRQTRIEPTTLERLEESHCHESQAEISRNLGRIIMMPSESSKGVANFLYIGHIS